MREETRTTTNDSLVALGCGELEAALVAPSEESFGIVSVVVAEDGSDGVSDAFRGEAEIGRVGLEVSSRQSRKETAPGSSEASLRLRGEAMSSTSEETDARLTDERQ